MRERERGAGGRERGRIKGRGGNLSPFDRAEDTIWVVVQTAEIGKDSDFFQVGSSRGSYLTEEVHVSSAFEFTPCAGCLCPSNHNTPPIHTHVHTQKPMQMCTHINTHACTHKHTYKYAHINIPMKTHVQRNIAHTNTRVYMHIPTNT